MVAPLEHQRFRSDAEAMADMRPFAERSYRDCHRSWAVHQGWQERVLVQVVDYQRDGYGGKVFVVRIYLDDMTPHPALLYFQANEDTLEPVDPSQPQWRLAWEAGRAREERQALEKGLGGEPTPNLGRVRL